MTSVSWDYKEPPPWDEITDGISIERWRLDLPIRLIQVDTGSDQWAVVITCGKETDDVEAQMFYERST